MCETLGREVRHLAMTHDAFWTWFAGKAAAIHSAFAKAAS